MFTLNNRELALVIWLGIFLLCCLAKTEIRHSIWAALKSAMTPTLVKLVLLICLYVALLVYGLSLIGLWESSGLKVTVLWVMTSGIVVCSKTDAIRTDEQFFKKQVWANVSAVTLFEYIVAFQPFSLSIELIVFPLVVVISVWYAVAAQDHKNKSVENLMITLLLIWACVSFYHSVDYIIHQEQAGLVLETAYDLVFPLMMTVLFLPFLYILRFYVVYEIVLIRIGNTMPDKLRRWACIEAIKAFKFDTFLLDRWSNSVVLRRLTTKKEVMMLINEQFVLHKHEQQPHFIHHSDGWSPYFAQKFLSIVGLETNSYTYYYEEEWGASSPPLKFGDRLKSNSISYFITGDLKAAKNLKVMTSIHDIHREDEAKKRLLEASELLTTKAIKRDMPLNIRAAILAGKGQEEKVDDKKLMVSRIDWSNINSAGYTMNFSVEHIDRS
ncbi:hypothetical protein [Kordiimonas pumila]|uniref:Uncharacterized protein n=1 Tax=Kordiimonas pumila TaxID=2161677 RepID=A0ABV7D3C7_9PROT|nr:hypothetical protein [Kordiimonas pumila]